MRNGGGADPRGPRSRARAARKAGVCATVVHPCSAELRRCDRPPTRHPRRSRQRRPGPCPTSRPVVRRRTTQRRRTVRFAQQRLSHKRRSWRCPTHAGSLRPMVNQKFDTAAFSAAFSAAFAAFSAYRCRRWARFCILRCCRLAGSPCSAFWASPGADRLRIAPPSTTSLKPASRRSTAALALEAPELQ